MLDIFTKSFNELSTKELYDLLQLRSDVFVVEQNCVYLDPDGKDEKAYHILGYKNDQLVAYTRVFAPGDYFEDASIGRVVVARNEREHRYGYDIMKASINSVKELFQTETIVLSAQYYLKKFYNNLGFKEVGEEYLEDDIPHIKMIRS